MLFTLLVPTDQIYQENISFSVKVKKWLLTSQAACDFVVLIPNVTVYNHSLSNLQLFFLINYSNLNSSRYAGTDQSASGMITVTQEWPSLAKDCHPYSGLKQRDWFTFFPNPKSYSATLLPHATIIYYIIFPLVLWTLLKKLGAVWHWTPKAMVEIPTVATIQFPLQ